MNKSLLFIFFLFSFEICVMAQVSQTNEWGDANCDTQTSISLKDGDSYFRTNQNFKISILIKNLSTNDAFRLMWARYVTDSPGLSITIDSASGSNLLTTTSKTFRFSGMILGIKPGEIQELNFDSAAVYEFHDSGVYKVRVKIQRRLPGQAENCDIVSNPLYITIK